MNARAVLGAVVMGVCLAGAARGQELPPQTQPTPPPVWDAPRNGAGMLADGAAQAPGGPAGPPAPGAAPGHPPSGLSEWILYRKCESCFGPLNPNYRPLCMELFFRVGPDIPVGGTTLGRELHVGWAIQGGGRALLFNPAMTKAFTVEAHIINYNNGAEGDIQNPLSILLPDETGQSRRVNFGTAELPGVTIRRYNRTLVGLGFGQEYYLMGTASDPGNKWRAGWDWGGRYGSARMDFREIRHRTDVIGAMYVGAHTDVEVPCGPCALVFGARFEWNHTWSDILQRATDVQSLTTTVNFGLRY